MTILLGSVLATGLLLMVSPRWWPPRATPRREDGPDGFLRSLIDAAGFSAVRTRVFTTTALLTGVIAGALALLFLRLPVLAVAAAVLGIAAPFIWLSHRAVALKRARRALWPDICDHLIASIRAGLSLSEAVASLASSAPAPLRPAFAAFQRDLTASGHFDSAIRRLKLALADPVADRIVETLRMVREVGGTELVPVLRNLATAVRADSVLRGEIEARQSWVRGAAVLGVSAPWVVLALLSLRPEGARAYASADGMAVVIVGGSVSVFAFWLMSRIGRLPAQRRWFGA